MVSVVIVIARRVFVQYPCLLQCRDDDIFVPVPLARRNFAGVSLLLMFWNVTVGDPLFRSLQQL